MSPLPLAAQHQRIVGASLPQRPRQHCTRDNQSRWRETVVFSTLLGAARIPPGVLVHLHARSVEIHCSHQAAPSARRERAGVAQVGQTGRLLGGRFRGSRPVVAAAIGSAVTHGDSSGA